MEERKSKPVGQVTQEAQATGETGQQTTTTPQAQRETKTTQMPASAQESPTTPSRSTTPEQLEKHRKPDARFVIVDDKAGIFLGTGRGWSLQDGHDEQKDLEGGKSAYTVNHKGEAQNLMDIERRNERFVPNGWRLVEVSPDLDGFRASVEACANVQLPRW